MAVTLLAASTVYAVSNIAATKHNLASGGGNAIHGSVNEICIYCHTPHNAIAGAAPLWTRLTPAGPYTVYTSATLDAVISNPPGPESLACLSCHDGTIAVDKFYGKQANGVTYGGPGPDGVIGGTPDIINGTNFINTGRGYLGTNLSNDHPIGFDYKAVALLDSEINGTYSNNKVKGIYPLFGGAKTQMECASCHKVHDNTIAPFLRATMTGSQLCLDCHLK